MDQSSYVLSDVRRLLIDLDNGPEIARSRTQFMKRLVEFSDRHSLTLELAYYPPSHSKYNPIERCWGILENHWNRWNTGHRSEPHWLGGVDDLAWHQAHHSLVRGDLRDGCSLNENGIPPHRRATETCLYTAEMEPSDRTGNRVVISLLAAQCRRSGFDRACARSPPASSAVAAVRLGREPGRACDLGH